MNRTEAKRHLDAHNWSQAERHFRAVLAEPKRSSADRLELLIGLTEAQRCLRSSAEAALSMPRRSKRWPAPRTVPATTTWPACHGK